MVSEITTIRYAMTYCLCQCAGCDDITVITDTDSDHYEETVRTFHPARTYRKRPSWVNNFVWQHAFDDDSKYPFFIEIYNALDTESYRLAVLGIRSLVEHIMIEKVGDRGGFKDNLDEFQRSGHISSAQRRVLEHVVELGHAVTHRAHEPSRHETVQALDVTETIIKAIYVDSGALDDVTKTLPERKPRPPKAPKSS